MTVEDVDKSDEARRATMRMLLLTTTCSVARVDGIGSVTLSPLPSVLFTNKTLNIAVMLGQQLFGNEGHEYPQQGQLPQHHM